MGYKVGSFRIHEKRAPTFPYDVRYTAPVRRHDWQAETHGFGQHNRRAFREVVAWKTEDIRLFEGLPLVLACQHAAKAKVFLQTVPFDQRLDLRWRGFGVPRSPTDDAKRF